MCLTYVYTLYELRTFFYSKQIDFSVVNKNLEDQQKAVERVRRMKELVAFAKNRFLVALEEMKKRRKDEEVLSPMRKLWLKVGHFVISMNRLTQSKNRLLKSPQWKPWLFDKLSHVEQREVRAFGRFLWLREKLWPRQRGKVKCTIPFQNMAALSHPELLAEHMLPSLFATAATNSPTARRSHSTAHSSHHRHHHQRSLSHPICLASWTLATHEDSDRAANKHNPHHHHHHHRHQHQHQQEQRACNHHSRDVNNNGDYDDDDNYGDGNGDEEENEDNLEGSDGDVPVKSPHSEYIHNKCSDNDTAAANDDADDADDADEHHSHQAQLQIDRPIGKKIFVRRDSVPHIPNPIPARPRPTSPPVAPASRTATNKNTNTSSLMHDLVPLHCSDLERIKEEGEEEGDCSLHLPSTCLNGSMHQAPSVATKQQSSTVNMKDAISAVHGHAHPLATTNAATATITTSPCAVRPTSAGMQANLRLRELGRKDNNSSTRGHHHHYHNSRHTRRSFDNADFQHMTIPSSASASASAASAEADALFLPVLGINTTNDRLVGDVVPVSAHTSSRSSSRSNSLQPPPPTPTRQYCSSTGSTRTSTSMSISGTTSSSTSTG